MNNFFTRVNRFGQKPIKPIKPIRWLQRYQLRQQLLQKSERMLADIGISRELLLSGVRAWPWRLPEDAAAHSLFRPDRATRSTRQAVAELNAYSDRELADLGIARSRIAYVVRHGRPGFPEHDRQQAA